MDDILRRQLESIEIHIGVLYEAEEKYLTLDAATDHLLATLSSGFEVASDSKTISEAAATRLAKQNAEWVSHKKSVAIAEADFHRQRHLLDLKNNAFQAEYLSMKVEASVITKQGNNHDGR